MAALSQKLEISITILPVTAVEDLQHFEAEILLVGSGNLLEVHHVANHQRLCRSSVLEHQAIHGIIVLGRQHKRESCNIDLLVYGGRQAAWVILSLGVESRAMLPAELTLVHTFWLQDWILCAQSCSLHNSSAVLLTSYNGLSNIKADQSTHELQCTVLCESLSTFLYSADVLQVDENSFIVASGTAFGELLIWHCRFDQNDQMWHAYPWREYHGHSGSIFGVSISPRINSNEKARHLVATCSDDRTIHIWDTSGIEQDAITHIGRNMKVPEDIPKLFPRFEKDLTMTWAHLSRIWKVDFGAIFQEADENLSVLLLSIGEDGQAQSFVLETGKLFSSHPAALTKSYIDRHHAGKNIWAWCCSHKERHVQLVTGGADGQVISRLYNSSGYADSGAMKLNEPFKTVCPKMIDNVSLEVLQGHKTVVFKSYLVMDTNQVIVTTESGLLLTGDVSKGPIVWKVLAQSSDSQHLVLSSNLAQNHVYFVDRSRLTLCAVNNNNSEVRDICQLRSTKVSTVQVACSGFGRSQESSHACIALTYFGSGELELIWVTIDALSTRISRTSITLPETFETTSACVDMGAEVLLLGSRAGAVAVFTEINDCTRLANPTVCRRRVHGEDTVTSITVLKDESDALEKEPCYLSTGRDGTYCTLKLDLQCRSNIDVDNTPAHLHITHRLTPPLGPHIEGAYLVKQMDKTQRLLLYGFRSKQFVVWDETNQTEVMAVACGGAHRSWNLRLEQFMIEGATFVWTKAGMFMFYSQTQADHKIIQPGGHGREIKALAVHNFGNSTWLVATGSEDTDIRLFEYKTSHSGKSGLRNIAVIRKHTTGLQDLHFSPDGTKLLSAAGMEELFAWHLSPVPVLGQGVVFAASLPRIDAQSDARILNIDVKSQSGRSEVDSLLIVAGFSNGKIEIIQYDSQPAHAQIATFTVLNQLDLGTICLTQVHILPNTAVDHVEAMIGATNGFLISTKLLQAASTTPDFQTTLHKIHQNSVTAMQVIELTPHHILVVTGGDDNSLTLTIAHQSSKAQSRAIFQSLTIPKAHAAALTALGMIELRSFDLQVRHFALITAGNDQYLQIWHVTIDTASLQNKRQSSEDGEQGSGNTGNSLGHASNEIAIEPFEELYTNVADISEMAILGGNSANDFPADRQSVQVAVVGVGMEVLDIKLPIPIASR